jgi:hypothetical protein
MDMTTDPGMFISPIPDCPEHRGPMRYDLGRRVYTCQGWDGEGCDYETPGEWRKLGDAERVDFG